MQDRRERLEQAASEARAALSERREVLDDVETITAYAEEMREFLGTSELTESRAFIHSFVKEIAVAPGADTIPMPEDSRLRGEAEEVAVGGPVLSTVTFGRIWWTWVDSNPEPLHRQLVGTDEPVVRRAAMLVSRGRRRSPT